MKISFLFGFYTYASFVISEISEFVLPDFKEFAKIREKKKKVVSFWLCVEFVVGMGTHLI